MKVAVREFQNVFGYPTLNRAIHKAFKNYNANIVIGTESLFSKHYKPEPNQFTIVIDGFSKLRTSGVPVLGYQETPSLVFIKKPFGHHDLKTNKVKVSHPFYLSGSQSSARPSIALLLEVSDCDTPAAFKKLQGKYTAELKEPKDSKFKWLRRVINQALKVEEVKDDE